MKKRIASFIVISIALIATVAGIYFYNQPAKNNVPKTTATKVNDTILEKVKSDTTAFEKLKYAVLQLGNSDSMINGNLGFYMSYIDSDTAILEFRSNQSLVPASVMKTITTGVALKKLGANYHFTTRLQYDGVIDKFDRVLNGNIYIKGGGDPSLGSSTFKGNDEESIMANWVAAIKKLGIDSIDGAIIADADGFDEDAIPYGWAWEDMLSDYGIAPCGLSFRDNMYDIEVKGGKTRPNYKCLQNVPELNLYNQLANNTNINKNYAYAVGGPYSNERLLRGEINASMGNCTIQSALPDPPYYCSYTLYNQLKRQGIAAKDSATTIRKLRFKNKIPVSTPRTTFYTTHSPSLASLVNYTNMVSNNFYAESMLRAISYAETGYGSTMGGISIVRSYWKEHNVDLKGFYMVDGSGISRFDGVTAKQLSNLLKAYAHDSVMFNSFYNSLPIAGQCGTLSNICKGTLAEQNIHAKSGYMTRVRSYAGYVTTKSGKMLSFAMIANNHTFDVMSMRNELEKLMVLMAELD